MQRKLVRLGIFLASLALAAGCIFLIITVAPTTQFFVGGILMPINVIVLVMLWLFLFLFSWSVTKRLVQGLLVSIVVCLYLVLRFFGITHWFFSIFLALLFVLIEVLLHQG